MTRARLREHGPTFALALVSISVLAWLGLVGFALTDYDDEVAPSVLALLHGDLHHFLTLAPAYGGSLILRAPFSAMPRLWGGGQLAAFRTGAMPCLIGCAVLATAVVGRMRAAGRPALDRAVVLVALTASPTAMRALDIGHPEELLGAALCIGAIMLAADRPGLASIMIGLAVANKPWALVAVPVLLVAVPGRVVVRSALTAAATALAVVAPLLLAGGGGFASSVGAAAKTNQLFQPWQVWYLFGPNGRLAPSVSAGDRVLRFAPDWVTQINRPVILLVAAAVSLAWWLVRHGRATPEEPLLLLALVLHLRCLLDPWNFDYYALAAVMALAAWEGLSRPRRAPVLTLLLVVGVWQSFGVARDRLEPDLLCVMYLGWALPLAAVLGAILFKRPARRVVLKPQAVRTDIALARPRC